MMSGSYADLEIRILEQRDEGYPVELTFSGEQEFLPGTLDPGFLPWVPSASPDEDGQRLFEWLFADEQLKKAWAEARGQNPLRRVRLRIDATAPELHALPWELLSDVSPGAPPRMLAADSRTPFSRYLRSPQPYGSPVARRPIKVLVALSSPRNLSEFELTELDITLERQTIEDAVSGSEVGQLELTFLEPPVTLDALQEALKGRYHILHIVAHGAYSQQSERAVLYLADAENRVSLVSDADLSEMLAHEQTSLQLVYLASCQSATRSLADAFRGFAPRLIASGIPAVLAMQEQVSVETAQKYAGIFYRQLVRHGYVDMACNEARSALRSAGLPGASVPVLYMRLRSGMLFAGQILGGRAESFWSTLLGNIREGVCTPILGPRVTEDLLPSHEDISRSLARDYAYPFDDQHDLPRVAQFVATVDNRRLRRDIVSSLANGFRRHVGLQAKPPGRSPSLSQAIEEENWLELSAKFVEAEIHHQLADLDLPLYLTTNFDSFMTLALRARGREGARRESINWREPPGPQAGISDNDLNPLATVEAPVVLHLFGTDEDLRSMVLTEDDHLDYLARISRDFGYLLPTSVQAALASTTLLFLGYRLEDLDLKVIMRGLLPNLDLARWEMLHVAVQVEATKVNEEKNKEVIEYFRRYFGHSRIDVYWGSTRQFVADLHARWREYGDGSS